MTVAFPYSAELAAYDLGRNHPLRPERFTLAVSLMRAFGLLDDAPQPRDPCARVVQPDPVTRSDLELVHAPDYVDVVIQASSEPGSFRPQRGLGPGDTPVAHGIHEAASLACGATALGLRLIVEGDARRALSVAGGLHHAHHERAAGFCVYNDPAVAIAMIRRDHPGLRVVYVDIDAHHGDGVQEAFYEEPDVLTVSVHESGRYLFPGTGRITETGHGAGKGSAVNVPLPPLADDACYRLVLDEVIAPAVRAFAPDAILAQCGADAHHADPLTHLGLTLAGYRRLVHGLVQVADEVCDGRLCCTGGGGYGTYSVVPRAWTLLLGALLGIELPDDLPEAWRQESARLSGELAPRTLTEDSYEPIPGISEQVRAETASIVERVRAASPWLASRD